MTTVLWRCAVIAVLARCGWDSIGMLVDEQQYIGPAYDVLRTMPPAGGVRLQGAILSAVTVGGVIAAHRLRWAGQDRALRWCLTVISGWYTAWAAGLVLASVLHGRVLSWTHPASVLVVVVIAVKTTREMPRHVRG